MSIISGPFPPGWRPPNIPAELSHLARIRATSAQIRNAASVFKNGGVWRGIKKFPVRQNLIYFPARMIPVREGGKR